MKLLYIWIGNSNLSNIRNKVESIIDGFNSNEVYCKGLLFFQKHEDIKYVFPNTEILRLDFSSLPYIFRKTRLWKFRTYFKNRLLFKQISKHVSQYEFDYAIIRYFGADYHLLKFCKKFKNKIILEHTTKESVEFTLKAKQGNNPDNYYYSINEKFFPRIIEKQLAAHWCISNEVADYIEKKFRSNREKSIVCANGINLENRKLRVPNNGYETINVLFLSGFDAPWHGFERIIESLISSKNKNIHFYYLGDISDEIEKQIKSYNLDSFITVEKYKPLDELDYYFNLCHVGLCTLALYKKEMDETSALKPLEYLARGLPICVGYNDTNLQKNIDLDKFVLKVANDNSQINIEQLIQFAKKTNDIDNHHIILRNLVEENLTWKSKTKQILDFIEAI